MKPTKHVAIFVETSRAYGRGLLRGFSKFHQEHGTWSIYFKPHELGADLPPWLKKWRGDGILVRLATPKMVRTAIATGLPFIDLRGAGREFGIPQFGADNESLCRAAFEHLRDHGMRQFAFVGEPFGRHYYDDERRERFIAMVRRHGAVCYDFQHSRRSRNPLSWEQEQRQFIDWLLKLPKPIGVFAVHDDRGLQILEACRIAGIAIPDQVAVVGVDNDEFLCNLAIPSLSSVDLNVERIGYEAAKLLDRMMSHRAKFEHSVGFPPAGVVARRSTDVLTGCDPDITAALRFIREHACQGITVSDVERHVAISRSLFNRRFKQLVGRTPKAEILHTRIERAKQLLIDTQLSIARIATLSGFSVAKYFIAVFNQRVGSTPRAFRNHFGRFNGLSDNLSQDGDAAENRIQRTG